MIGGVTIQEIIWTSGLPYKRLLPQFPGVPHLHVTGPQFGFTCIKKYDEGEYNSRWKVTTTICILCVFECKRSYANVQR